MATDPYSGLATTGVETVTEYLRAEGIHHEVVEHEQTMSAAAEAAATQRPQQQVAKTVVLHDGGVYLIAVVPASHRLDLRKLRELLDAGGSLQLATEAQMADDFPTLEVGAVPPFGPMTPAAEVVDRHLLDEERVLCAAGAPPALRPTRPSRHRRGHRRQGGRRLRGLACDQLTHGVDAPAAGSPARGKTSTGHGAERISSSATEPAITRMNGP